MAWLGLFLLAKAGLLWRQDLQASPGWEFPWLAAAALIFLRGTRLPPRLRAGAAGALAAAAALLLWRQSFLPPLSDSIAFLLDPETRPSARYLAKFLRGCLPIPAAGAAAVAGLGWALKNRGRPVFVLGAVALAAASIAQPGIDQAALEREVSAFHAAQALRRVDFPKTAQAPFDVVILQVCSLGSADMAAAGLARDPFWDEFDLVFERFRTATSYSRPAAQRLLRAPCGHAPHEALLGPAPPECRLSAALAGAGLSVSTVFNHDGRYQSLAAEIAGLAFSPPPLDVSGLKPAAVNFNGAPIYSDLDALRLWHRAAIRRPRALYYNTLTLHGGAVPLGRPGAAGRLARYREQAQGLFADLRAFFQELERSKRPAVVLLVPEHGAALGAGRLEAPGLRDVPVPALTEGPAALKLIGLPRQRAARIKEPVSYLALAELLSRLLKGDAPAAAVRGLSPAGPVAENKNSLVLESGGRLYLRWRWGKWVRLKDSLLVGRRSK